MRTIPAWSHCGLRAAAVIAVRNRSAARRIVAVFVLLIALNAVRAGPRAQEESLEAVLARTGEYTRRLHMQLAGIVAEETYVQDVRGNISAEFGSTRQRRTLRSDLLLVRPATVSRYVEFRDVFEVDGAAVRDRQERLTALFLEPSDTNERRLRAIVQESARHNIGGIPRTINTPMLALSFLLPETQPRFRYRRDLAAKPRPGDRPKERADASAFRVTSELWCVEFNEVSRPTVIRTNEDRDFAARGRVWVDPASGVVVVSELNMSNGLVRATISVSYRSEAVVGFQVPVEMRERYDGGGMVIEGHASYGRFRAFDVKTHEVITKPPGPEL